jgi:hypothetical protein
VQGAARSRAPRCVEPQLGRRDRGLCISIRCLPSWCECGESSDLGRSADARSGRRCLPAPRGSAKHHQSGAELIDRGRYSTPTQYGTAVHRWIEESINGPTTTPRSPPPDPNSRAEASLRKSEDAGYGLLGSRRIDVLENPGNGTVCVYDIKTGESGLRPARAAELASTVQYYWPGTQRIIVTEVRPRR